MSNYPPGVTGFEPQIAGYPEGEYLVTTPCTGYIDEARIQPDWLPDQLQHIVGILDGTVLVRPSDSPTARARVRLLDLISELQKMPVGHDIECGFEGKVDAQFEHFGRSATRVYWTCPICGKECEEDREAGDDDPDL